MDIKEITWNNDLIYQLIDLYREKPLLWDNTLQDYKDKQKKTEAWAEIAKKMGTTKEAVERKVKILSTQFRREIVKNENDESKWFAYKKMLFLKPRVMRALAESELTIRDDDASTSSSSQIRVKRLRLSETESEETKTDETYRLVSELYRERFSRDEFTVFGEHVAVKLRKLDNLYAKCTAQYHINNILYKAEIGEYDWLEDSKPDMEPYQFIKQGRNE